MLKIQIVKGTKLSEFEKGEITALKRVGKSQREISKGLGRNKTVICNYLKSPNKLERENHHMSKQNFKIKHKC